jgi:hypothetical protein
MPQDHAGGVEAEENGVWLGAYSSCHIANPCAPEALGGRHARGRPEHRNCGAPALGSQGSGPGDLSARTSVAPLPGIPEQQWPTCGDQSARAQRCRELTGIPTAWRIEYQASAKATGLRQETSRRRTESLQRRRASVGRRGSPMGAMAHRLPLVVGDNLWHRRAWQSVRSEGRPHAQKGAHGCSTAGGAIVIAGGGFGCCPEQQTPTLRFGHSAESLPVFPMKDGPWTPISRDLRRAQFIGRRMQETTEARPLAVKRSQLGHGQRPSQRSLGRGSR